MKGLFVTGTDTGVGKTLITAGLTALYRKNNIDCVALKPVETGCAMKDGELFPEDGNFLWRASQNALNMDDVARFPLFVARCAVQSGCSTKQPP